VTTTLESLVAATLSGASAPVHATDALIDEAARHGVLGLVEPALAPEARARARTRLAIERLAQERIHDALDEALRALARAGSIDAVALKGPVLSERLWGDPFARPTSDVDLAVAPRDLDRALRALGELGWRDEHAGLRYFRETHHHVTLARPGSPPLELHHRLLVGFGTTLELERFRTIEHVTARGARARVLAPEDELVFLGVHAALHAFARLAWLVDLALLLRRGVDVDRARSLARALRVGRAFDDALATLADRLAIPGALRSSRRHRAAAAIAAAGERWPVASRPAQLARFAFRVVLCDGPSLALAHARANVLRHARRAVRRVVPLLPEEWSA
jgi:hypothetical protein